MPTILEENQKNIRQALDVSLIVSGGSGTLGDHEPVGGKLYDRNLTATWKEPTWPMLLLADLQQDGFPLDGTHILVDESQDGSPSGKIGARGSVGEPLWIMFTSTVSNPKGTIFFSGVSRITVGDEEIDPSAGFIIISSNNLIRLWPEASDSRVEVSTVLPGVNFIVDNKNLISCVTALRSDIGRTEQSWEVSELQAQVYYPNDISDTLAVANTTLSVRYSAGYPDDMSDTRTFYLAEPMEWKDNVVTIKAQDSSSRLEAEGWPMYFNGLDNTESSWPWSCGILDGLYTAFCDVIVSAGISPTIEAAPGDTSLKGYVQQYKHTTVIDAESRKDTVARFMNALHASTLPVTFNGIPSFWPTFVDAGIPRITWSKPTPIWDIYEKDCEPVERQTDPPIMTVNYTYKSIPTIEPRPISIKNDLTESFTVTKGQAFTCYVNESEDPQNIVIWANVGGTYGPDQDGWVVLGYTDAIFGPAPRSWNLPQSEQVRNAITGGTRPEDYGMRMPVNAVYVPWSYISSRWSTLESTYGTKSSLVCVLRDYQLLQGAPIRNDSRLAELNEGSGSYTSGTVGDTIEISDVWNGIVNLAPAGTKAAGSQVSFLPEQAAKAVKARSNKSGKFKWKGNPKIQPRDMFRFHTLSGKVIECTAGSVTGTHEGGGYTQEVEYREGWV